jgi:predicted transcriptional regulator
MSNILQIASDGASATKIVDKAGLSSAQMGTYVQRLAKCRLIETSQKKDTLQNNEQGETLPENIREAP